MAQHSDETANQDAGLESGDDDERVGEAIEAYLALAEQGKAPGVEEFAERYPDLKEDVRAGLEGLELVHGLLGMGSANGSGSGQRQGLHHRIESGHRIAGYRVVRELGRGGMGTVYEAVHVGLDRPVALKVLGMHAAPDSSARRRFLNEARTAAGLHHTHIVPVFDVGQVGGLCFYAMQRIEGSGLDCVVRYLRRTRPSLDRGGGGPSSKGSWSNDNQSASGASSINSRLGNLWIRVSSGWLRRQDRPLSPPKEDGGRSAAKSLSISARPSLTALSRAALEDPTASWSNISARTRLNSQGDCSMTGSAAVGVASHGGLAPVDLLGSRGGDELVPFDPPRGSAYFRWVAEVGLQSADALAHAHHQGVIHRDVKPSNLLIDGKGNIWVTDFGLARRLADPGLTHHDSLLGTPRYMSPEQARTGSIDGRTDVYSLGATLYELLTLRPPFDGRSAAELIDQIGETDPLPPSAIDPRIPRDLETIVLKTLAKRPVDRYATAAELAEDLARFLNHEPVRARRISVAGRLWRVAWRHPGITTVSTAAAAAVLAIATIAYVRVVAERDEARRANGTAKKAVEQLREANHDLQAEAKQRLMKTVEVVAQSASRDRRSQGLDLIQSIVALQPEAELRPKLRDEAVKFLVLREVEAQEPELATGRTHGIVFGPTGHRLAVLSEDEDEISVWDVARRHHQSTFPLRTGTTLASSDGAGNEPANNERIESSQGGSTPSRPNRNSIASPTLPVPSSRRSSNWFVVPRVAQCGQSIAAVLPDDKGLALFDLDPVPGAPPRTLVSPNRAFMSVVADPRGRRLVTVEQFLDDTIVGLDGFPALDFPVNEFEVNLWDPEHLDRPLARLQWTRPGPGGRAQFPIAAISLDGNTVAVAASRGKFVRLFSAIDGRPLTRGDNRNDGRTSGRNENRIDRTDIDTQTELSAIAFGPNDLLATAGTTAGGVVIKIWNWADPRNVPISLSPLYQNFTRVMRFSPKGTLLAIAGAGPIELWDTLSHNLVAVLRTNDQANDLAFAPDGRTLAATGRSTTTSVWRVHDSAARTQLSGIEMPVSLAFSSEGTLAGVGWRGDIWSWKDGRCPELGPPLPQLTATPASTAPRGSEPAKRTDGIDREPARKNEPDRRREGARPPARGAIFAPPVLAFDKRDRLVVQDARGIRVWPAGSIASQAPPTVEKTLPRGPATSNGPFRVVLTASTDGGEHMMFVRSSSFFLWNAQAPDEAIVITPPSGWGTEATRAPRTTTGGSETIPVQVRSVQLAPGAERVYLLEQGQNQGSRLRVWALPASASASNAQAIDLGWDLPLGDGIITIALRGDGQLLAAGDRTGGVTLVDTTKKKILGKIPPLNQDSDYNYLALTFSPDGQSIAIGSPEGTVSLWSVSRPQSPNLDFHLPGNRRVIFTLAFDAQSRRLASAGSDPLVEVWDLELLKRELNRLGVAD
jgi:serine/threonine protein kinase/WD40 repeat protein